MASGIIELERRGGCPVCRVEAKNHRAAKKKNKKEEKLFIFFGLVQLCELAT